MKKNVLKFLSLLPTCVFLCATTHSAARREKRVKIDPEKIRAHVKYLSSDALEGRGTGQKGGDMAAKYIAAQFKSYGLEPASDAGTYVESVPMVSI
ncbi:MAG TPA: peptidase M28, partial [Candidatus Dormibacteraeota bacterium]|nr:peptidase M28 [Candidatus Dormibacteraeota bacterium]